uniref:LpxL/LpxP family acyltransferase n=1 Tax=Halomonas sp. TaxID=1486246 RepID=UPI002610474F|nr:glycosyl transferase [Halomonas sp.]
MKSSWARVGERGTLGGMLLMVHLRRLGEWPFKLVLWPVILWYYATHAVARHASRDYLARLDPNLSRSPLAWHQRSFHHFLSFGRCLMDKVGAWSGAFPADELQGDGVRHFSEALTRAERQGPGGLVLVAHHGNLDVVNALNEQDSNFDVSVIMHSRNARKFNELLSRATGRRGPNIIEINDITPATAQLLDARIRAGGFVVVAADRVPPGLGRYRWLDFLNAPAAFPEGPFLLAALLRCPVYLLACVRDGDAYRVDFTPFDDTSSLPRKHRQAWLDDAMFRYVAQLENHVRHHPLQWFNFFPFWQPPEISPP